MKIEHPESSVASLAHIFPTEELCIFDCSTETWSIKTLRGDVPPKLTSAGGAVLGDALYIYGGYIFDSAYVHGDVLYKLDLITMKWHRLNPEGSKPVPCNKLVAWAYEHKVYFFGGYGECPRNRPTQCKYIHDGQTGCAWNNQLIAYNTLTNRWEWPKTYGQRPSPRAAHACDISDGRVFIMGGRVLSERMDGLFCLNMETMTWSGNLARDCPDPKPEGRSWHSFTFIAPNKAVIYGGWNTDAESLDDCWILDTNEPVRYHLFNSILNTRRFWHSTVYNQPTGDLVCTGGTCVGFDDLNDRPSNTPRFRGRCAYFEAGVPGFILMNILPKSLLRLCIDAVLEEADRTRPFWDELPVDLTEVLKRREAFG